jgi:hypothetical protein
MDDREYLTVPGKGQLCLEFKGNDQLDKAALTVRIASDTLFRLHGTQTFEREAGGALNG